MVHWVYHDKDYWNRLRIARDNDRREHVLLDGADGEKEFDDKILEAVPGKEVLDVGCGTGLFTIEVAGIARKMVGIDFSEEAILRANKNQARAKQQKVRFELADANKLPFAEASFDVVVSRRGPVTDNMRTLSEGYRVLRGGGKLMEITIGEKDKHNIAEIFGRGQMFGATEKVTVSKKRMLEKVGFLIVEINDYLATEIFQSMNDLINRLESAPIIPDFDSKRDQRSLELVEDKCKTSRGIETEAHRVTIIAAKSIT